MINVQYQQRQSKYNACDLLPRFRRPSQCPVMPNIKAKSPITSQPQRSFLKSTILLARNLLSLLVIHPTRYTRHNRNCPAHDEEVDQQAPRAAAILHLVHRLAAHARAPAQLGRDALLRAPVRNAVPVRDRVVPPALRLARAEAASRRRVECARVRVAAAGRRRGRLARVVVVVRRMLVGVRPVEAARRGALRAVCAPGAVAVEGRRGTAELRAPPAQAGGGS